jgi:hypothetical protein
METWRIQLPCQPSRWLAALVLFLALSVTAIFQHRAAAHGIEDSNPPSAEQGGHAGKPIAFLRADDPAIARENARQSTFFSETPTIVGRLERAAGL